MSILAGIAALVGTIGVQVVKLVIVDVPTAIAAAGNIIIGVAGK